MLIRGRAQWHLAPEGEMKEGARLPCLRRITSEGADALRLNILSEVHSAEARSSSSFYRHELRNSFIIPHGNNVPAHDRHRHYPNAHLSNIRRHVRLQVLDDTLRLRPITAYGGAGFLQVACTLILRRSTFR